MAKPREVTWSDVKTALAQFDRTGLLALLKDMHALRPENRAFLAARLGVGSDPLTPYKRAISRWVYPDLTKGQDISVAKAKKAIAEYRKAVGRPDGMAELSIYYTEQATRLIVDCGIEDEALSHEHTLAVARAAGDQAVAFVRALLPAVAAEL